MRAAIPFRSLVVLLLAVVVSGVAVGAVALSSEPEEGTVNVDQPVAWQGSVELFSNGNVCQPPIAPESPTCDVFTLTADLDEKYWASYDGGAELEFVPAPGTDPAVNLNVKVFDKDGATVATGTSTPPADATSPAAEQVMIPEASRGASPYSVVVYNNTSGDTDTLEYSASARIESQASVENGGAGNGAEIPTEPVSDADCVDGLAGGVFPCENVDLKSFLPISELGGDTPGEVGEPTVDDALNDRLNDIWGWTDPLDGKEYAIVGKRDGTAFVDVTDASNPRYLGEMPTYLGLESPVFNVWRDMKVYKDHAFVVSEEPDHGMQVFDLTRLRGLATDESQSRTFTEDAHYAGVGNTHNIAINEDTGYAYLIGTNMCEGGSHIVDIRDPQAPAFAGCVAEDGYTHDNQCVVYNGPDTRYTGREICFDFNEDTLTIVDVTEKGEDGERPQLARLPYDGSSYTHQGWLTPDQTHVLMNDELDEQDNGVKTSTRIVDVSTLTSPRLVDTYTHPVESIDHNNYLKTSSAYQANYRSGLRILDTREVTAGTLRTSGFFDVFPADDAAEFNGAWSNYPYFASGNVIVSGIEQGLFVLRPRAEAGGIDGRYAGEPGDVDAPQAPATPTPGPASAAAAAPTPAPSGPADTCTPADGFASVRATPDDDGGLSISFRRARQAPVTIDVFRRSVGRRIVGGRRVARFAERSRGVTWSGRDTRSGRKLRNGYFVARLRMEGDVRRVALRRAKGRFTVRPTFARRATCGLLRSFRLARPVFGGRQQPPRSLSAAFSLGEDANVRVTVLRGRRVIRTLTTGTKAAGRTHRLRLSAKGAARGNYRIRLTAVTAAGERVTSTLTARRL